MVERTGKKIGLYGIFKNSNNTKINQLYDQVTAGLLPSWPGLLFGKNEYNLDDGAKISKLFLGHMQTMKINGVVALCCGFGRNQKTLVVSSDDNYSSFRLVDKGTSLLATCGDGPCQYSKIPYDAYVECIKAGTFEYTYNLPAHIVLTTKNVSKNCLEEAVKSNGALSDMIDNHASGVDEHGKMQDAAIGIRIIVNEYQNSILKKVTENPGDGEKAILLIPLQDVYHTKKVN